MTAAAAVPVVLTPPRQLQSLGGLTGPPPRTETLGINPADVKSSYLIVGPSRDPTAAGTVSLSVYVPSDYGGGYLEFAGDGSIKRVNYPS